MRPLEVINMSEEEALELRQSEKMASRSSDLQAKLREAQVLSCLLFWCCHSSLFQETARRQSTEHEVAIGKEISARAHHQKEVKALSKQRAQDLADMVQLEQEVSPSWNIYVGGMSRSRERMGAMSWNVECCRHTQNVRDLTLPLLLCCCSQRTTARG